MTRGARGRGHGQNGGESWALESVARVLNRQESQDGLDVVDRSPYRGICRYLKVSMWQSETIFGLPSKGQARLTYLYLLTGPHTLAYHVPGLYNVGQQSLRESLAISPQEFARALADLRSCVGMKTDFVRSMVWLPSALDHLGPPANPNIVRGYCRALHTMPKSTLRSDALATYRPFLASLGMSFLKPFADSFPEVCQTPTEPCGIDKRKKKREIQSPGRNHARVLPESELQKEPSMSRHGVTQSEHGAGTLIDFEEGLKQAKNILKCLND